MNTIYLRNYGLVAIVAAIFVALVAVVAIARGKHSRDRLPPKSGESLPIGRSTPSCDGGVGSESAQDAPVVAAASHAPGGKVEVDPPPNFFDSLLSRLGKLCVESACSSDMLELLVRMEDIVMDDACVDAAIPALMQIVNDQQENERKRLFCVLLLGCAQRRPTARDALMEVLRDNDERMSVVALYGLMIRPPVGETGPPHMLRLEEPEERQAFWFAVWLSYSIGPILTGEWDTTDDEWDRDKAIGLGDEEKREKLPNRGLACAVAEARVVFDMPDPDFRQQVMARIRRCRNSNVKSEMLEILPRYEDIIAFGRQVYWEAHDDAMVRGSAFLIGMTPLCSSRDEKLKFLFEVMRYEGSPGIRGAAMGILVDLVRNDLHEMEAAADLIMRELSLLVPEQNSQLYHHGLDALARLPLQSATDFVLQVAHRTSDGELRRACYQALGVRVTDPVVGAFRAQALSSVLRDCVAEDISTLAGGVLSCLNGLLYAQEKPSAELVGICDRSLPLIEKRLEELSSSGNWPDEELAKSLRHRLRQVRERLNHLR